MSIKERTIYFDYLRVFATFAVIVLHVSAKNWHTTDVNGFEWQVFNFYDSIVRWTVPIFVMISGALFLNRDIPMKKMYSKYILRIVTAFFIWSFIYVLFLEGTRTEKVLAFIKGNLHMWFLFMIVGIYMCIPFIKAIAENDNRIKYYLILAFIFAFFIPEMKTLVNDFGSGRMQKVIDAAYQNVNNMNMYLVFGYVSYFILGYYLNKIPLSKKMRVVIYALGILGFVLTVGLDSVVALKTQKVCSNYYGNMTVNVLLEAVAVFVWFKHRNYDNERMNCLIQKLSKYSFGTYLVHLLVIQQLATKVGLNTLSFNPIFSVICISVIVAIISFGISALLNQIPFVKKYMV